MYHFCTLFDRNYLFKGVALYNSLCETGAEFILHILCLDELTENVLGALKLGQVSLISCRDFEDPALTVAKSTRSLVEFYWTCTPSLPLYVLEHNPKISLVTYLDADLLFFSDPTPIFEEFGDNSILIIEHRFPKHLKQFEVNGIYNVQFISVRRDKNGLECLQWWRERCLEWCYYRLENGKMGDQKYLDDWPTRFERVHVLKHVGAGVAPWNVSQYRVRERHGRVWIENSPLIFYHFHQFNMFQGGGYFLASDMYGSREQLPSAIYERYIDAIRRAMADVQRVAPEFSFGFVRAPGIRIREVARRYLPWWVKTCLRRGGW